MAHDQKDSLAQAPTPDEPETYEVGYGKPPAATRFKPGQSGNPRGRPKGSKNIPPPIGANTLQDIILKEAYRPITGNDSGKQVTMPMATAVMRSIAVNAAKGQHRSQKLFTDILSKTESQRRKEYEESRSAFLQIQHNWEDRLIHCRQTGEPIPNPAPHPDDLRFDPQTGDVTCFGPINEADRIRWERTSDRVQMLEKAIEDGKKELEDPANTNLKYWLEDDIAFNTKLRDDLDRILLKGWRKRK